MYCPTCGEQVPDHSRFCLHCGEPIEAEGVAQAPRDDAFASPAQTTAGTEVKITSGTTSDAAETGSRRRRAAWFLGWFLIALALLIAFFGLRRPAQNATIDTPPPVQTVSETELTPTYSYGSLVTAKAQRATEMPRPRPTRTPRPSATSRPTATPWQGVSAVVMSKGLNVRAGPGVGYQRLGAVGQGTEFLLSSRDASGAWVRGRAPAEGLEGWLSVKYMKVAGDVTALPVVEAGVAGRQLATATVLPRPTRAQPRPTNTPKLIGIGVTRANIQSFFERLGFGFELGEEVRGQPQVLGKSEEASALVQLIGPPENLVSASFMTFASSALPTQMIDSTGYMVLFLKKAAPGWEEGSEWIGANFAEAVEKGKVETTHGDLHIVLQAVEEGGLGIINLTVEAVGWE